MDIYAGIMEEIVEFAKDVAGDIAEPVKVGMMCAYEAGQTIRELYGKPHDISYKGKIDLVTEADLQSEGIIRDGLEGVAGAKIMSEESSSDIMITPGRYWIVDPLDGTTNFAHGFPFFAPSIALVTIGEDGFQAEFGCVFIPLLHEFFWAVSSKGAYLNLDRIQVSQESRFERSLLATGFPYDVHDSPEQVLAAFGDVITRAQGIRRAGAAAIDLAYVACGRFDGFWEMKLKPWDTAAGMLLVQEAGGMVSDFTGKDYNPFMPEICASNGFIHEQMTGILAKYHVQP